MCGHQTHRDGCLYLESNCTLKCVTPNQGSPLSVFSGTRKLVAVKNPQSCYAMYYFVLLGLIITCRLHTGRFRTYPASRAKHNIMLAFMNSSGLDVHGLHLFCPH